METDPSSVGANTSTVSDEAEEPLRSKICQVCKGEAETFHLNYGASACFSCRAFFRRTIQRSRNPEFHCKNNWQCEVTVKTRRKCQGCRYKGCLRAGMQPDQVLTNKEKKERFRKMIKKQIKHGDLVVEEGEDKERIVEAKVPETDQQDNSMPVSVQRQKRKKTLEALQKMDEDEPVKLIFKRKNPLPPKAPKTPMKKTKLESPGSPRDLGEGPSHSPHSTVFNSRPPMSPNEILPFGQVNSSSPMGMMPPPLLPLSHESPNSTLNYSRQTILQSRGSNGPYNWYPPVPETNWNFERPNMDFGQSNEANSHPLMRLAREIKHEINLVKGEQQEHQFPRSTLSQDQAQTTHQFPSHFHIEPFVKSFDATMTNPQPSTSSMPQQNIPEITVDPIASTSSTVLDEETLNTTVDELVNSYLSPLVEWEDPWPGNTRTDVAPRAMTSSPRLRKRMMVRLEDYRDKWKRACEETAFAQDSFDTLLAFHLGETGINKSLLRKHLVALAELYKNFAFQLPEFKALSKTDQRKLLGRNTPIYIQYFCGRYLNAQTGLEQFQWLFPFKLPDDFETKYGDRLQEKVPFSLLNRVMQIFDTYEYARHYEEACKKLNEYPLMLRCHFTVGLACLWTTSYATILDDADLIQSHLVDFYHFADWTHDVFDCSKKEKLASVVRALESMATFFETHVSWKEAAGIYHDISKVIALPFTLEEDCWLVRQFERFDRAFHEVSFGEEMLKEFIMFAFDVPLSKNFLSRMIGVFSERFRKIMKLHEEFNSLSDLNQAQLWQSNIINAVSLCISKVENFETGNQQLRFSLGYLDDSIFKRNYEHIDQSKIKRMTIFSFQQNGNYGVLDEAVSRRFAAISARLSARAKDVETFKLLLLITMFTPNPAGASSSKVTAVQDKYLTMFKRRLEKVDGTSADNCEEMIKGAMSDIQQLSQIIKLVLNCGYV